LAQNLHYADEGAGNNFFSRETTFGAENFTLSFSALITSISHVAHHASVPQPTSIDWRIYADDLDRPGTLLYSGDNALFSTNVEGSSDIFDLTRYIIDLPYLFLEAGDYWVAFHNVGGEVGDPHWTFSYTGTSFDNLSAISEDSGGTWSVPYPGNNLTFRVMGEPAPIPEPATMFLLGTGLVSLAGAARRKKKNQT
jgi:hypothetical protein